MPVRIGANGEIIHEAGPSTRRSRHSGIHTIHEPPQTPQSSVFQSRNSSSSGGSSASSGGGQGGARRGGVTDSGAQGPPGSAALRDPFSTLSQQLGIDDKVVHVPGIPAIGLTPTEVKLIYVITIAGLGLMFGGRAVLFVGLMFVLYKRSNP